MERTHEIVVWGATGFTGELVAEHLCERYGADLRWALGGRNREKLEAVRARLATSWPHAAGLPLVIADSHDPDSLAVLAASTRVVCTTVGPYLGRGEALVEACVNAGSHYCDLTGEVPFIQRMIAAHHAQAVENHSRIVTCCGFDSVPSDLGCWVLQEHAQRTWGKPADQVRFALGPTQGGFSGGTVASMIGIIDMARSERSVRKVLFDPYSLDPADDRGSTDGPDRYTVAWSDVHGQWTAPFIMGGINTRVVRRSHALLGRPWGPDFSYTEVVGCGTGPLGWLRAQALNLGFGLLAVMLSVSGVRNLLLGRVLPLPGEGPERSKREAGFFRIKLIGRVGENTVQTTVRGKGDPGYLGTSRMLAESAVSLARDALPDTYGVLTPATAMGRTLVDRLAKVDITFDVV